MRKNRFAASQDIGSNIVVGVEFLSLQTRHLPWRTEDADEVDLIAGPEEVT